MGKYPIFLEMGGRRVVVVGAGAVAARKVQALLAAGARLVVVAEHMDEMLTSICQRTDAKLIRSRYAKSYLVGAALAIAATNNRKLNRRIYRDCQELEILCNVVDEPELCDFFMPAVVERGDLKIAIGTEGDCPAYAGHVRRQLEQTFTDKHGEFLAELQLLRSRLIKELPDPASRKAALGRLVDDMSFRYFIENGPVKWRAYAGELVSKD